MLLLSPLSFLSLWIWFYLKRWSYLIRGKVGIGYFVEVCCQRRPNNAQRTSTAASISFPSLLLSGVDLTKMDRKSPIPMAICYV